MTEVFLNLCVDFLMTEVFHTLIEAFPCFFLSCNANARVKLAFLDGARPALFHILSFSSNCVALCIFICVVLCIVVCVGVLPPGDNPIAVNKIIIISLRIETSGEMS
jgi:hypothetical protein